MSTPFYLFFNENIFACIDSRIYNTCKTSTEDYLKWFSTRINLLKGELVQKLEEIYYFSAGMKKEQLNELSGFIVNNVIPNRSAAKPCDSILLSILPDRDYLVFRGRFHELAPRNAANAIVHANKKDYAVGANLGLDLKELEQDYVQRLNTAGFTDHSGYDKKSNIGYLTDSSGFYVYAIVNPYILYERLNDKYYQFPETRIGLRLSKQKNKIIWGNPVVIDNYSHPALPDENKPFQDICSGLFNFNAIREKYKDPVLQVRAALVKTEEILTMGYFSNVGSWHKLKDEIFRSYETRNITGCRVTNK